MSKQKIKYSCNECGTIVGKWTGQCLDCQAWNSLEQFVEHDLPKNLAANYNSFTNYSGEQAELISLSDVTPGNKDAISTGFSELDRVFGNGLVTGSISLLGGDPGIGKSTLLLQLVSNLSKSYKVIYVSGEESSEQLKSRADRLKLSDLCFFVITETNVEQIISISNTHKPSILVIDSVQTMWLSGINAAPGSVSQVREVAGFLVKYAKQTNTIIILIGHVTKDGSIAGPRILEHIVDTVLYFESDNDSKFRMLRAVKNRFGPVNELGIFAMTEKGLKEINNPSAIFLARSPEPVVGSVVMVSWEGSRPFLIEVQALVDESHLATPRRVAVGLDANRLSLLLAVLHRHAKIRTGNHDIFVNVVGGVKISETAIDLALLLAIFSSLKNKPLPAKLIVFGEVGLSGEIRPVQSGGERIREAYKLGFTAAIVPNKNIPKEQIPNFTFIGVNNLQEALEVIKF